MRLSSTDRMSRDPWPSLPYDAWKDTYATLHMWAQIVGKIALAQSAPLNHSWAVEIPAPIPFERDTVHQSYDPEYARRFWRLLVQVHRVFTACRSGFVGKCSPVHFFWGSFDLAVTRFSGRPAPPRSGPAFERDAYSHEVISHGFWPGSAPLFEPTFYAYAVPEPQGLKTARVQPDGAFYHTELNEFILPYEVVRRAASPDAAIAAFVDSTYDQAATLAGWDRAGLHRTLPP
jgi:hypothetical protein